MRFEFRNKDLAELYAQKLNAERYPADVITKFFECMNFVAEAVDLRDLYALKSLHFEKLLGKWKKLEMRSLRLTKKWRLFVTVEIDEMGEKLVVWEINKHEYE